MVARAAGAQGGQFVRLMTYIVVLFEIAWFFGWIGRLKVGKLFQKTFFIKLKLACVRTAHTLCLQIPCGLWLIVGNNFNELGSYYYFMMLSKFSYRIRALSKAEFGTICNGSSCKRRYTGLIKSSWKLWEFIFNKSIL